MRRREKRLKAKRLGARDRKIPHVDSSCVLKAPKQVSLTSNNRNEFVATPDVSLENLIRIWRKEVNV